MANRVTRLSLQMVPFVLQRKWLTDTPIVVLFHTVGNMVPHIENLYKYQSVINFDLFIEKLLRLFRPLEDLKPESILSAGSRRIIFTFDDGLKPVYDQIAPLLERRGIPAIVFLNPSFLTGKRRFYRFDASLLCGQIRHASSFQRKLVEELLHDYGLGAPTLHESILNIPYKKSHLLDESFKIIGFNIDNYYRINNPFMSAANAVDLQRRGFFLGAHTMDHPRFTEITHSERVKQTIDSIRFVQSQFGVEYGYFSFPFNDEGTDSDWYDDTRKWVDLYFTLSGWRRPDRNFGIFHRVGLDTADGVLGAIKSNWRPI